MKIKKESHRNTEKSLRVQRRVSLPHWPEKLACSLRRVTRVFEGSLSQQVVLGGMSDCRCADLPVSSHFLSISLSFYTHVVGCTCVYILMQTCITLIYTHTH